VTLPLPTSVVRGFRSVWARVECDQNGSSGRGPGHQVRSGRQRGSAACEARIITSCRENANMIEPRLRDQAPALRVHSETLAYQTTSAPQFVDITEDVLDAVSRSGGVNGVVVVFSSHTTAAIKINESEPELVKDMGRFLAEIVPIDRDYCHNNFDVRTVNMEEDECPNAHSHCQHLMLSSSESIPLIDGRVQLGRWQRIFLVELDRAKARNVTVQVVGT
jgi:secondary thiamine-phosphate synthase enzyme